MIAVSRADARPRLARARAALPSGRFLRHFAEMLIAMLLGMALLGGALSGFLALAGTSYADAQRDLPALFALAMAFAMTVPMAAWMRHRRHRWARVAEMSAAMFLPAIVLIALLPTGVLDGRAASEVQHGLMVPAMLAAMLLRRSHYS